MFDKIVDSIACYSLLNITMVGTIKRRSASGRRFLYKKQAVHWETQPVKSLGKIL